MENFIQEIIQSLLAMKDALKVFFVEYQLEFIWSGVRNNILSPELILTALLPWLLLERFYKNADTYKFMSPNLVYDLFLNAMNGIFLIGTFYYLVDVIWYAYETWLPFLNLRLLDNEAMWVQVLGAFLIRDFTFFASHWARHKIPWMWYFHSIHHDQKRLTPATTLRSHPIDMLNSLVISAIPIMMVGGTYHAYVIFNVLIYTWRFFIHSNVKIDFGPLNYLIVSPQFHRVHHSVEDAHIDHNFGEWLSIWDFIFGTAVKDFKTYPKTGLKHEHGLAEKNYRIGHLFKLWIQHMIYPFKKIAESITATKPTQ